MIGALSVVASSVVDSHASPSPCLDSPRNASGGADHHHHVVLSKSGVVAGRRKNGLSLPHSLELRSPFLDSWQDRWLEVRALSGAVLVHQHSKKRWQDGGLVVVNEVAVRGCQNSNTQLLYIQGRDDGSQPALNPQKYQWCYDFVVSNKPGDGKRFIVILGKKRNHAEIYQEISDENLELMWKRLMETVIWPSDETNTEKIS